MIGNALDPRRSHLQPVREAVAKFGGTIPKNLPEHKKAYIALAMQRQAEYMKALEASGSLGLKFHGSPELVNDTGLRDAVVAHLEAAGRKDEATKLKLGEATTSAAVAAFTVQSLVTVEQIYERTLLDRFADVRVQNQPRAFVHYWKQKVGEDGGTLETNDLFNAALDPDYTKIAAEGDNSRSANFQMASSTITATENAIHAEWTLNAQQDLASQYGLSLPESGREFLALQLKRELEGECLQAGVDGAANSDTWNKTPPAGTIYETLDPDKWRNTMFRAMTALDNDIFKHADGFRGSEVFLCDPDTMQLAEDLNALGLMQSGMARRATAGNAVVGHTADNSAVEGAGMVGIGRWDGYKARFMAANTMLFLPKPGGEDQATALIHSVYVPITDLGLYLSLKDRKVTISAHTRTANVVVRPGLLAKLEIGD